MEDTGAIIDRIIAEHKVIIQHARAIDREVNDVQAASGLREAKESFVPGRFDQKQGLQKLRELLEATEEALDKHFHFEETGLLEAFEKRADKQLVSALNSLLREHEDLRNRFAHSQKHVAELTGGGLARHKWEASAHDMQAHISHTLKLLGEHADSEMKLLVNLRRQLKKD